MSGLESVDPVVRLDAIAEISALKARYWRCIDQKAWSELRNTVFTDDFAADFTETGGGTYTSADEVVAMLEKALGGGVSAHQGGAGEIDVETAEEASGTWAFIDHIEQPDYTLDGAGRYFETYRRTADGWRIATSRITRQYTQFIRPDAEQHVTALIYAYASSIDSGDYAAVGELFANGAIAYAPDAPEAEQVTGSEAVLASYEATTRLYDDGTPRSRHLTTNLTVDVDHLFGTATANSYFTVLQQTDELPLQPIISGTYADTFHIVEGVWCFKLRVIEVGQMGDLSQHLLFDLSSMSDGDVGADGPGS